MRGFNSTYETGVSVAADSSVELIIKIFTPISHLLILRELIIGQLEIVLDFSSKVIKTDTNVPELSDL